VLAHSAVQPGRDEATAVIRLRSNHVPVQLPTLIRGHVCGASTRALLPSYCLHWDRFSLAIKVGELIVYHKVTLRILRCPCRILPKLDPLCLSPSPGPAGVITSAAVPPCVSLLLPFPPGTEPV